MPNSVNNRGHEPWTDQPKPGKSLPQRGCFGNGCELPRFGSQKASNDAASIRKNGAASFFSSRIAAAQAAALSDGRIVDHGQDRHGNVITKIFPSAGAKDAIGRIAGACIWKSTDHLGPCLHAGTPTSLRGRKAGML